MSTRFFAVSFSLLSILSFSNSIAQSKADRRAVKQLKEDITYLASDELEGRRVGSEGEKKAAAYLEKRYKAIDVHSYKGQYRYPFEYIEGKKIAKATEISIDRKQVKIQTDAFPLAFSANKKTSSEVLPDVFEQGNIWMIPLHTEQDEANDAHFDWEKSMYDRAKDAAKEGATGVLFYDSYGTKYAPAFSGKTEYEALDIPVAYLTHDAYKKYLPSDRTGNVPVELNVSLERSVLTGHNVAAFINNNAVQTVIIGAHYDHLGYGQDGHSLYSKKEAAIHNGADDNASGTAALIQLAEWIKKGKLRNYNYLFVSFSGEEEGLIGSKAFVRDMKLDSNKIAYMINMDMIGRLNDSTHALTIGGVGTSPSWGQFAKTDKFKIAVDSAGVGPSDHTSFYNAGIPVLFFFTGLHTDYHKPSDDAEKINYEGEVEVMRYIYDVVAKMEKQPKPAYRVTKSSTVGKVRFKVTLGIMPDYSYQEAGVKVDGVTDDKPAIKAGVKAGDIIVKLGSHKVAGMQTYMEALGKFAHGDKTTVTVVRGGKEIELPIEF